MSFISVDLGATNLRVAIGSKSGLKKKISEKTDRQNGPEGIPRQIIRMVKKLTDHPTSIGIGSIGPLDIKSGKIVNTPNLPFNEISLTKPISEGFKTEVLLANDCSAAVLGEHVFGGGKDIPNLVYITMSTGLGCGAIVDGHLLSGKDGNAHEVGHITIDPYSDLICGCGCTGHWEAYSSGLGLPRFYKKLFKRYFFNNVTPDSGNTVFTNLTSETIFNMANDGTDFIKYFFDELGKVNSQGFANVVNVYDPELITVGGSIALNNPDLILKPIINGIDKHLINRKPRIEITPLGGDVVLYGALALAANIE
ncbi:ROK family protein [Candidatus Bathyarchaeota archaeon]|nr:ROK family protein [Candidatus Bathyarchaeota archaeon]